VVAGLIIGVLASLGLGRLMNNLLNTARFDVTGIAVTVAALLLAGIVACWLPSWRATRTGLAEALRV
jgi:ABC-type lipoprotein release transport system permease subunit